jgi:Putative zinc-finger
VNSTSQLDLHPDAESLNAFAERALGVPEREQVLAHLAGCSRCRQVIFLAQQAAADAEAPAPVPATRLVTQPVSWFWNWRIAWVPAAAFAAALALVVTLHTRHTTPAPELAKVSPQSEAPAPIPQDQTSVAATHRPAQALTANSVAGKAQFGAPRRPTLTHVAPSAAPPVEPGTFAASTEENRAALPSSMPAAQPQASAAQFKPESAVTAWQQERQQMSGALSASANTSRVSQKSMQMEAYSAHTSRPAAAGSAGPRMSQQPQSAPTSSFDMITQEQFAGLTVSGKLNPPLPSGLAAISTATARNLTLEIDLAGALFLSDDSGKHWKPVAQQWTGRAVEVRTKTGSNSNTAQATGFELQNDVGSTWASADGTTWTAQ